MIKHKGYSISAVFAGIGRPAEQVVRRLSASGNEGVALLGTYSSLDEAKAAIDAICPECSGTGTAGGPRCTNLECCGPCEACDGTGIAELDLCIDCGGSTTLGTTGPHVCGERPNVLPVEPEFGWSPYRDPFGFGAVRAFWDGMPGGAP